MWWDGLKDIIDLRFLRLGISAIIFVCLFIICFRDKKMPKYFTKLGDMSFSIYIVEYFTTKLFKILIPYIGQGVFGFIFLIPLVLVTFFFELFII